jgi:phage terminase large subunit-like protein
MKTLVGRGRASIGPDFGNSEPVPAGGLIIKRPWIRYYDHAPQAAGQIMQSWDTATKDGLFNDFSACVTARVVGNRVYVLDVFRERLDFPRLKAAAIRLAREWRTNVSD